MAREKSVEISSELRITVRELTVDQIERFVNEIGPQAGEEDFTMHFVMRVVELLEECTGASLEDVRSMTPSEIQSIYEAFREVNSVFFEIPQKLGIADLWDEIKKNIVNDLFSVLGNQTKKGSENPGCMIFPPSSILN